MDCEGACHGRHWTFILDVAYLHIRHLAFTTLSVLGVTNPLWSTDVDPSLCRLAL